MSLQQPNQQVTGLQWAMTVLPREFTVDCIQDGGLADALLTTAVPALPKLQTSSAWGIRTLELTVESHSKIFLGLSLYLILSRLKQPPGSWAAFQKHQLLNEGSKYNNEYHLYTKVILSYATGGSHSVMFRCWIKVREHQGL